MTDPTTTDVTTDATTTERSAESYWQDGVLDRARAMRGEARLDFFLDLLLGLPRYIDEIATEKARGYAEERASVYGKQAHDTLNHLIVEQLNPILRTLNERLSALEDAPPPEIPALDVALLSESIAARLERVVDARPRLKTITRDAMGEIASIYETVVPDGVA